MAKKHHMTKHQYKVVEKKYRPRKQYDDDDFDGARGIGKRKKTDGKLKNHLRHLHGSAVDLLDGDLADDELYAEDEE